MTNQSDLSIKNCKFYIWKENFAIVKAKRTCLGAFANIIDKNEITLVIEQRKVKEKEVIEIEKNWKILTFDMVLPFGLVGFTIPCSKATVKIIFHETASLDGFSFRQYGPMSPNGTWQWYDHPTVVFGSETINGRAVATAILKVVDGDLGDNSGANGSIAVLAGPAWPEQPPAERVPAMTDWGKFLLVLLLALMSLCYLRKHGRGGFRN